MSWLSQTFQSSIGKKLVMSLTGLFLCTFLIVHLSGNAQLFKDDEGFSFNVYAVFMTTFPVIKFISYGLYALILYHAFQGLVLAYKNRKARGSQGYASVNNSSSWASRNMALLGTILLVYLIVHMSGFWYQYKFGEVPYRQYQENLNTGTITSQPYSGEAIKGKKEEFIQEVGTQKVRVTIIKDLYTQVEEAFKNPLLVLFYLIGMVAVAFHLVHGFQSAFQSLGWNHPKYSPAVKFVGTWLFGVLIPLGFAAMPVYFLIKSL